MKGPLIRGVDIAYVQRVASGGLIKRASDGAVLADLRDFDFVIIKATQGTAITDGQWANSYAMARKFGLVTMAYHFNDNRVSIPAQADRFLAVAKDADYLWLDQEGDFGFSDAQAQAFIDYVRSKGRKCGLYHSASGFGGVSADARWVADYRESSRADGSTPVAGWDIWQFSSEGGPNGLGLDLDYMPNDSPLAAELRLAYVPGRALAPLKADVLALTVENGQLQQAVLTAQGERDDAKATLAAEQAENERLDAENQRLLVAAEQQEADRVAAKRLLGIA